MSSQTLIKRLYAYTLDCFALLILRHIFTISQVLAARDTLH